MSVFEFVEGLDFLFDKVPCFFEIIAELNGLEQGRKNGVDDGEGHHIFRQAPDAEYVVGHEEGDEEPDNSGIDDDSDDGLECHAGLLDRVSPVPLLSGQVIECA